MLECFTPGLHSTARAKSKANVANAPDLLPLDHAARFAGCRPVLSQCCRTGRYYAPALGGSVREAFHGRTADTTSRNRDDSGEHDRSESRKRQSSDCEASTKWRGPTQARPL